MMIEEKIAHSILHQQKDVIAKHLGQVRKKMCETYKREEVLLDNKYSPDNGEPGMFVRLIYDKKCRTWSLESGDALKRMPGGWGAEAFLHYDDSEQSNWIWVAEQLIEGVIQSSLEEEY